MVRTIIHKTNTVNVIIGCSIEPIPLDENGIIRFFTLLARVEERLQITLENSVAINFGEKSNSIPDYKSWLVTMWHFGQDGLTEYAGKSFSIAIGNFEHVITRIYLKDFGRRMKIRIERQEYPKRSLEELVEEKLSATYSI